MYINKYLALPGVIEKIRKKYFKKLYGGHTHSKVKSYWGYSPIQVKVLFGLSPMSSQHSIGVTPHPPSQSSMAVIPPLKSKSYGVYLHHEPKLLFGQVKVVCGLPPPKPNLYGVIPIQVQFLLGLFSLPS